MLPSTLLRSNIFPSAHHPNDVGKSSKLLTRPKILRPNKHTKSIRGCALRGLYAEGYGDIVDGLDVVLADYL